MRAQGYFIALGPNEQSNFSFSKNFAGPGPPTPPTPAPPPPLDSPGNLAQPDTLVEKHKESEAVVSINGLPFHCICPLKGPMKIECFPVSLKVNDTITFRYNLRHILSVIADNERF